MTALDSKLVKFLIWLIVFFSGFAASFAGYLVAIRFQDSTKVHEVQTEQIILKKEHDDIKLDNVYIKSELINQDSRIDKLEATIEEKKISLQPSINDEKDN